MGRATIEQAIAFLQERSIRAARGYPNTPCPQLRGLAVAVNVHKFDTEGVSYSAVVCMPPEVGAADCETAAEWVANVWSVNGAKCSWTGCEYDETMQVYAATVIGRWENPVVLPEE